MVNKSLGASGRSRRQTQEHCKVEMAPVLKPLGEPRGCGVASPLNERWSKERDESSSPEEEKDLGH